MRYTDPRVRQTLNHITENLESANQRTQATLFTVSENCIQPCLASLQPCLLGFQTCLEASCQPCFSARDDVRRHRQPRYSRRGRETAAFDFYDDWEREEEEWGNDELDALLSGNETQQPGRNTGMTYGYGTRGPRRRSTAGKDALADDPTVVPQSSIFGFLERLPWKIGGRGARYRPNAASLQTNVGRRGQEADPLMPDDEGERSAKKGRPRSGTAGSRSTVNSLSSRGDIFPSDDEDDAREIDDEFALRLGRRSTNATTSEDRSSKKRPLGSSRASTKTASSKGTRLGLRSTSASSDRIASLASPAEDKSPSLTDLKREEEEVQEAEESELQVKRQAAQQLASERGLDRPTMKSEQDSKEASLVEANEVDSSPLLEEANGETDTNTPPGPPAKEGANAPQKPGDGGKPGKGPT